MDNQALNFRKWSILIIIPIVFWGFYWYVGFDQTIIKLVRFIAALLLLVIYIKPFFLSFSQRTSYGRYIAIIILLILISFLICYIYWGQNPILTYRAAAGEFALLYFYTLKKYRVSYNDICKLVIIFAIIYVVLWLIALAAAPKVLFGNLDEIHDDRGFFRILQLNGIDTLCLFFFICLVKIKDKNSNKSLLIIAGIVSFVVIFLALSRNLILSVGIVAVIYLLKYQKGAILFLFLFLILGGYGLISNNVVFSNMLQLTETHVVERSENNLRLVEYKQFYKLYPFHVGTALFGNGESHVSSSYGSREEGLKSSLGFNRSDAGYVHLYTSYGIIMVFVFLLLLFKVIKQRVDFQYLGFKLFIYFLFIVNVLTSAFFSYAVSLAICLYVLDEAGKNWNTFNTRIASLNNNND